MRARKMVLAGAVLLAVVAQAGAAIITLEEKNAIVQVDPESSAGMYSWTVDGVENLHQQWFWYRVGSAGGEKPLNNLPLVSANPVDTNKDDKPDFLTLKYQGEGLAIEAKFTLTGVGFGTYSSDMGESITLKNTSAASIVLHFYQYCDMNLNRTPENDTVEIRDGIRAYQSDPLGGWASETVSTANVAPPSHHEAALISGTPDDILARLMDGSPTDLSDAVGPITGDVAWAFQWDFNLGSGKSVIISKDKLIVPEPATLGLLAFGAVVLFRRRRAA